MTDTTNPTPVLLSIYNVATLINTSARQVRNMIARGQVPPPRKIPGLGLRWDPDAVQKWLAAKPGPGDSDPPPSPSAEDDDDTIPDMSPQARKYYDLYVQGVNPSEIARLVGRNSSTVTAGLFSIATARGLKHYCRLREATPAKSPSSDPDLDRLAKATDRAAKDVDQQIDRLEAAMLGVLRGNASAKPAAVSVNPRGEVVSVQRAPVVSSSPMVATPGGYAKAAGPSPTTATKATKIDPVSKDILIITTERIAFGTPAWCERMAALHVKPKT